MVKPPENSVTPVMTPYSMQVPSDVVQNQVADFPMGVEGVKANHFLGEVDARQTAGVHPQGGAGLIDVDNLDVLGQGVGPQGGARGVDPAADFWWS